MSETKEMSYADLFPGRFLTADHFKGKKVTVTIADVYTDGFDQKKKRANLLMKFKETPLEIVIPKTNAYCIKMMFGLSLAKWVGKRVTFFPTTCLFGKATVDCIRVWGSPDIDGEMILSVPQGRKPPIEMVMHAMKGAAPAPKPEPRNIVDDNHPLARGLVAAPDANVIQAWEFLGWSREQGQKHMGEYAGDNYFDHLSALLDRETEEGAA